MSDNVFSANTSGSQDNDEHLTVEQQIHRMNDQILGYETNETHKNGHNTAEGTDAKPQQQPLDIFGALTRDPVMHPSMLPAKIRDFVYDQAELLGCDPGAMGVTALAVLSSLISDAIIVQPKRYDTTYTEPARLWLILIGLISNKKTPMLAKLTNTMRQRQAQMKMTYDRQKEKYQLAIKVYETKMKIWLSKHGNHGGDGEEALEPHKPEKPREPRLLTNDYTNEALAEILCDNPRGILLLMDEIMTMFGGFDAYKSGKVNKDRPTTLEGYNGGPRDIDRKGSKDDRIHVPNWSFGVVGGIQYSKLDQVGMQLADDGLLQRFILMPMEASTIGQDRRPNAMALQDYTALVENLIGYDPYPDPHHPILLSHGAQNYREQMDEIGYALQIFPGLSEAFQGHAGKLGGTFARLLLTMHIIEHCPAWAYKEGTEEREALHTISEETAHQTFTLMTKFIIPHAMRQYERIAAEHGDQLGDDVRWLAGHILARSLNTVNLRVCQNARREFKKHSERAKKAMDLLTHAMWLDDNGKVNELVHQLFTERATNERRSRDAKMNRLKHARSVIKTAFDGVFDPD